MSLIKLNTGEAVRKAIQANGLINWSLFPNTTLFNLSRLVSWVPFIGRYVGGGYYYEVKEEYKKELGKRLANLAETTDTISLSYDTWIINEQEFKALQAESKTLKEIVLASKPLEEIDGKKEIERIVKRESSLDLSSKKPAEEPKESDNVFERFKRDLARKALEEAKAKEAMIQKEMRFETAFQNITYEEVFLKLNYLKEWLQEEVDGYTLHIDQRADFNKKIEVIDSLELTDNKGFKYIRLKDSATPTGEEDGRRLNEIRDSALQVIALGINLVVRDYIGLGGPFPRHGLLGIPKIKD